MGYKNTAKCGKCVYFSTIKSGFCDTCERYGYAHFSSRQRAIENMAYHKIGFPSRIKIEKVIFNDPATIVIWSDGVKTVVKCMEGDVFDPEKGLAMAISKRALGNDTSYHKVFKEWLPEPEIDEEESIVIESPIVKSADLFRDSVERSVRNLLYHK